MIRLYDQAETQFDTNGIGSLSDAVSCFVTEERNGMYVLQMQYPITGRHYSQLIFRSIIFAKPNPFDPPQPFRIYRITRPINGLVTVYANHISYDLNGIPVRPFHTYTIDATLQAISANSLTSNIFSFATDKPAEMQGEVQTTVPLSARNILGGMEGSVLQTYRGEYKFDRWTVSLLTNRGSNNGVVLRYGYNLLALEQDEDYADLYTGVSPYWLGDDKAVYLTTDPVVFVPGTFGFERILSVDLSEKFESEPTEAELRAAAEAYIVENAIGVPKSAITIDYAMDSRIQSVHLCDTVGVIHTRLGVRASAKVVKTIYNELRNRYESITLGSIRTNIADTYTAQTQNLTRRIRNIEADYATNGAVREIAREEITNDTTILQKAESIIATALERYVRESDYEAFRSEIITQFSVLAGEVSANFTSNATRIDTLDGSVSQRFAQVYSFIRLLATITDEGGTITQQGGVVIGESISEIKLKLENDILYFFTGDEKLVTTENTIAWFSTNQLYVNNTTIRNLTLGTSNQYLDVRIVGTGDNRCALFSGRIA